MEEVFPVDMLDYLVCPETHQRLALAEPELLAKMKSRQEAGQLQNRIGKPIQEPVQQALVREDRKFAYQVSDGIPIMLIDEAIPLNQSGLS